jgi:hypothetical protein
MWWQSRGEQREDLLDAVIVETAKVKPELKEKKERNLTRLGQTYSQLIARHQGRWPPVNKSLFLCLPRSNKSGQSSDFPAPSGPNWFWTIRSFC